MHYHTNCCNVGRRKISQNRKNRRGYIWNRLQSDGYQNGKVCRPQEDSSRKVGTSDIFYMQFHIIRQYLTLNREHEVDAPSNAKPMLMTEVCVRGHTFGYCLIDLQSRTLEVLRGS